VLAYARVGISESKAKEKIKDRVHDVNIGRSRAIATNVNERQMTWRATQCPPGSYTGSDC
jgi:hypothetical protein